MCALAKATIGVTEIYSDGTISVTLAQFCRLRFPVAFLRQQL